MFVFIKKRSLFTFYNLKLMAVKFKRSDLGNFMWQLFKYLPLAALLISLKLYVVMFFFSSGMMVHKGPVYLDGSSEDREMNADIDYPSASTEDPESRQKQIILADLLNSDFVPTATNRTPETLWLFYNRIPRSGGKTFVALMQALGVDLDVQHQEHSYRFSWERLMTISEQKNLATWFEYNFWPKTYDRLALYINFTEHLSPYATMKPATITMLRDPVAGFISQFYNRRTDPDLAKRYMKAKELEKRGEGRRWYWRTLEDCILEGDDECSLENGNVDFGRSIPFLCGQLEECLPIGSRWALQRAKYMAEYEYSVVGVLEGLNATLAVLEHYIPAFFQGARQRFWSEEFSEDSHINKSPKHIKPLSPRAMKVLRQKLAFEYELYEFVKQKLAKQFMVIEPLLPYTTPLPAPKMPKKSLNVWDRFDIEVKYR